VARGGRGDTGEPGYDPAEIRWRVRVELESVFEHRKVRRRLLRLHRPFIGTGNRHIDLGAWSERDARSTAERARSLPGVRDVEASAIRGRFRRWRLRQRLAGNYWSESGAGAYGSWADGGGGGGDGGGGGNGGG
jgi:hypothetical protein